eukprot:TRINITY_DN2238_c0_g3_i1.p1 TRINITY_DN2238_c0_g3~~TRINITY_DN2238_c0_g3_i1.p1  ORF type:complete len:126 (-),score=47.60 TRINITY_DN2238_c0_g3_i1:168-545(-)
MAAEGREVIGKIVRVELTDGRLYVGRLQCVDRAKTLYMSSGCEVVDTEADCYQEYSVFPKKDAERKERYRYKPVGGVIIPAAAFTKIWLDKAITEAIPIETEDDETKKESNEESEKTEQSAEAKA